MAEYEKKVREVLSKHGCHFLRRGKGGHDLWHNPESNHKETLINSKLISVSLCICSFHCAKYG